MAVIPQTKTGINLFYRANSVAASDAILRAPLYPMHIEASFSNATATDTATVVIYGGSTSTTNTVLATISLNAIDRREAFTITSTLPYVSASITAINNPNANVTVIADAVEG